MDEESSPLARALKRPLQWVALFVILVVVIEIIIGPITHSLTDRPMETTGNHDGHEIYLAMFQYALVHNGTYPTGKNSTEVFQKLIDGGYADPSIFCDESFKIPGKVKPTSRTLQPENVCWDVTVPVDRFTADSWKIPTVRNDSTPGIPAPEELPLVFSTGYRIDYSPEGNAVPLSATSGGSLAGIYICYCGGSTMFLKNDKLPDGIVPKVISARILFLTKKYQQLTPTGALAPQQP